MPLQRRHFVHKFANQRIKLGGIFQLRRVPAFFKQVNPCIRNQFSGGKGMAHRHYFRPSRKIWRCPGCQEDFSVTSGTIFAFHTLPLRLYLAAVILFTNAVKGISALQVGRDLGVSHKTAYVLLHKIRESLLVGRDESALQGEIHVDGAYVGGTVRPENKKEDRVDRRLAENQDPDKRCIIEVEVDARGLGLEDWFNEQALPIEPDLLIRRQLDPGGRSRAFVNDTPVRLEQLRALGERAP